MHGGGGGNCYNNPQKHYAARRTNADKNFALKESDLQNLSYILPTNIQLKEARLS